MEHFYQSIDGWMGYEDTYREAVRITPDGGTIVEVGSFLGRSAAFMAVEIVNSGKNIRFVCIDPFDGHLGGGYFDARCALETFVRNMEEGGVGGLVEVRKSLSVESSELFQDRSVDFVFIDAAHDYTNAHADIRAWLPKVKPGGVIAGHDYGRKEWPMVRVAVQETLSANNVQTRADDVFWYKNVAHDFGEWLARPTGDAEYLCHIPYVNRPDLLKEAIDSLTEEERSNSYIIDQSVNGFDSSGMGIGHYRANRKVQFSQMMNFSLDVCRFADKEFSVFMHNDTSCVPGTLSRLIDRARQEKQRSADDWSVLFTKDTIRGGVFDYLCAFNMQITRSVGVWDETFPWYVSDLDLYNRFLRLGKRIIHCSDIEVRHKLSQTINSDPVIKRAAVREHDWARQHYIHKWGGFTGKEKNEIPYNGRP